MPKKKNSITGSRKQAEAPISCDLEIPIEEPGEGSFPNAHKPHPKLQLKIRATPENWRSLYSELQGDPVTFGNRLLLSLKDFYEGHIAPLDPGPPSPRATHTEAERAFMEKSRQYVAACIAIFEFWEKSDNPRPHHLSNLIERLPNKNALRDGRTAAKKYIPNKIARAFWTQQLCEEAINLSLVIPPNDKAFRSTYIDDNPYMKAAKDIVERLKNPDKRRKTAMEDLKIPPEKVESWAIVDCDIDDPNDARLFSSDDDDLPVEDLTIDMLAQILARDPGLA
ncbi:MAG: hypothetical protein PVG49_13330 [Desulfobacteraceae bacterium]|jgi:hypothetical protein